MSDHDEIDTLDLKSKLKPSMKIDLYDSFIYTTRFIEGVVSRKIITGRKGEFTIFKVKTPKEVMVFDITPFTKLDIFYEPYHVYPVRILLLENEKIIQDLDLSK